MKIMDIGMPLMTLYMAFVFPALLGVYWIINSVLAMVQQIVLKKMYPAPVFTEEDYKKAERELSGSSKKKQAKKAAAGTKKRNPNSLHHIDDDEEEGSPESEPAVKASSQKNKAKKGSGLIEPAPLKEQPEKEEPNQEGAEAESAQEDKN